MLVVIEKNIEDGIAVETVRVVGPFVDDSAANLWIDGQLINRGADLDAFEIQSVETP